MRKVSSIAASLLLSFLLSACSHLSSGQYIQLKKGETFKSLSKTYDVPLWQIQHHNQGKTVKEGSWVFLPLKRGVVAEIEKKRGIASVDYQEILSTNCHKVNYLASSCV